MAGQAYLAESTETAIARAADLLRAGAPVAFPTETVYGLGADTFNETALDRVFSFRAHCRTGPLCNRDRMAIRQPCRRGVRFV